jgi:hypothetical protein
MWLLPGLQKNNITPCPGGTNHKGSNHHHFGIEKVARGVALREMMLESMLCAIAPHINVSQHVDFYYLI